MEYYFAISSANRSVYIYATHLNEWRPQVHELWAVHFSNWSPRDRPFIGRILKVEKDHLSLGWLIGEYTEKWKDWEKKGELQTQQIPLEDVIMKVEFVDNKNNRLKKETIAKLKEVYSKNDKAA